MPTPRPTEITLDREGRSLVVSFDDGTTFPLPFEYLRVHSPSAEVAGHHNKQPVLQVGKEAVNVTDIRQVGLYAIKLFFDDGHKSGLFTWPYLYDLGANYDAHWAEYLRQLEAAGHARRPM